MADNICFAILQEERVNTFGKRTTLVLDAMERIPLSFSTLKESRAWIRICKKRNRRDGSTPTTYTVEKMDSPRFLEAYKATFGRHGQLASQGKASSRKARLRLC
jgi:hypothetical protein